MKAHYKTRSGRIIFEVEADSQKGLFKAIAELADVFEVETTCGLCGSDAIRPQVRVVEDNEFYEFACVKCSGRLDLGQHKKGGTLFVKRREGTANTRGWYQYKQEARE